MSQFTLVLFPLTGCKEQSTFTECSQCGLKKEIKLWRAVSRNRLLTCVLPLFSPPSQSSALTDDGGWQRWVGTGGRPPNKWRMYTNMNSKQMVSLFTGKAKTSEKLFFSIKKRQAQNQQMIHKHYVADMMWKMLLMNLVLSGLFHEMHFVTLGKTGLNNTKIWWLNSF